MSEVKIGQVWMGKHTGIEKTVVMVEMGVGVRLKDGTYPRNYLYNGGVQGFLSDHVLFKDVGMPPMKKQSKPGAIVLTPKDEIPKRPAYSPHPLKVPFDTSKVTDQEVLETLISKASAEPGSIYNQEEVRVMASEIIERQKEILKGRDLLKGVPEPRGAMPELAHPYKLTPYPNKEELKDNFRKIAELAQKHAERTFVECFCRYKGLTEAEFKEDLSKLAEEYNAFCAGFKAGRF